MSKFKVGDKVQCVNSEDSWLIEGNTYKVIREGFGCYYFEGLNSGYNDRRFELVESAASYQFTIGQEVLAAIGITRNLKRATITNVSAGKDNQGENLVGICVESMDVIVPEDKLFVMP